jgi:predicted nucleic acid-binding protein
MIERVPGADAYVVDASVAVKWHLQDEKHTTQALALLRGFVNGEFDLLAPEHIRYEVANAITVATQRSPARLTYEQGAEAIAEFLDLSLTTLNDSELLNAAYPLTRTYNCAFYDAVYLALAQRVHRPLVTADARFYQRVRDLRLVNWIADRPPR